MICQHYTPVLSEYVPFPDSASIYPYQSWRLWWGYSRAHTFSLWPACHCALCDQYGQLTRFWFSVFFIQRNQNNEFGNEDSTYHGGKPEIMQIGNDLSLSMIKSSVILDITLWIKYLTTTYLYTTAGYLTRFWSSWFFEWISQSDVLNGPNIIQFTENINNLNPEHFLNIRIKKSLSLSVTILCPWVMKTAGL